MFKKFIKNKIEQGVVKYFKAHPDVKLICVVGSIGKTTAKSAIATILSQKYRVGGALGNHNSELSAPLGILGIKYPKNPRNPFAWLKVLLAVGKRVRQEETVDVIVQELGTDAPGQITDFGRYLKPDITVLTAISAEHMMNFKTLDAVAEEELTAINFSKQGIINAEDVKAEFSRFLTNPEVITYGSSQNAEYSLIGKSFSLEKGWLADFKTPTNDQKFHNLRIKVYGEHSLRPLASALVIADQFKLNKAEIEAGLKEIKPYLGRMNLLQGMRQTKIIDDSYNSSPIAAIWAIKTLQSIEAPQRIAVLGSMNELGDYSEQAHQEVARECDYTKIDWVITVGDEAAKYLAPEAKKGRCQVRSFKTAVQAGTFLSKIIKRNAIILFKGSQGDIYLEEAIKIIAPVSIEKYLVRQSSDWLRRKQQFFQANNQINIAERTEDETV